MKILTAEQIRSADAYTIAHEPVKSIDLMERAGTACFDWIYENAPSLFPHVLEEKNYLFQVVCGTGNNGGDGLVVARLLQRHGYAVEVFVPRMSKKGSEDFETNFQRLSKKKMRVTEIASAEDIPDFSPNALIVEALFGTGLNRPPEGLAAEVIDRVNECPARVVSIDMPGGVMCDGQGFDGPHKTIKADYLLTFQVPKLCFFLSCYEDSIGEITTLDIGLSAEFLDHVETDYHLFTLDNARAVRPHRRKYSHKGDFGHALLVAGAPGKRGAASLCALGAMRAGAGKVTVHTDAAGQDPLYAVLPEAMLSLDEGDNGFSTMPGLTGYDAVGVGPGIGKGDQTAKALKLLIQECKAPLVLDADALNILADNPTWLAFLPAGTILTPHPGEFARLIGEKLSHRENVAKQREFSRKHNVYVVLKGAHTSISLPDGQVIFNRTGNPGMASAGMGDVLTGIITALRAQGLGSMEAAALGVYLHGAAGDLALTHQSVESLLATDLVQMLGTAFKSLAVR